MPQTVSLKFKDGPLGFSIKSTDRGHEAIDVTDGGQAQKLGIDAGDVLVSIGAANVATADHDEIVAKLEEQPRPFTIHWSKKASTPAQVHTFLRALLCFHDADRARHCLQNSTETKGALTKAMLRRAFKSMNKLSAESIGQITKADSSIGYDYRCEIAVSEKLTACFSVEPKHGEIISLWIGTGDPPAFVPGRHFSLAVLFKDANDKDPDVNDFRVPIVQANMSLYEKRLANEMAARNSRGLSLGKSTNLFMDAGRPLPELPRNKFDVAIRRRWRHDSCWTVLFMLYWLLEVGIAIHAFLEGRPARLFHGHDSLGNLCGDRHPRISGLEAGKFLWPLQPAGITAGNGGDVRLLCVPECPKLNDSVVDYIAGLQHNYRLGDDAGEGISIRATYASKPTANRCMPIDASGTQTAVWVTASVFHQMCSGWAFRAMLVAFTVTAFLSFCWTLCLLCNCACFLHFSKILSCFLLLGVMLVCADESGHLGDLLPFLDLSEAVTMQSSHRVSTPGDSSMLIGAVVAGLAFLHCCYRAWTERETHNSRKIISHTISAMNECNRSIIRCWGRGLRLGYEAAHVSPPTPNPLSSTESSGFSVSDVDVGTSHTQFVNSAENLAVTSTSAKDRGCTIRPLLLLPIFNAVLLGCVIATWALVFIHLVSLGKLKQSCECNGSLADCSCVLTFEFDRDAWAYAVLVHGWGLLWSCNVVLNVSRLTVSGLVSTWYFSEDKDLVSERSNWICAGPPLDPPPCKYNRTEYVTCRRRSSNSRISEFFDTTLVRWSSLHSFSPSYALRAQLDSHL
jgi:hypothetical protein